MKHSYFTQVLREEMEGRDIIQRDIARALGVSEGYVSDVLGGGRGPLSVKHIFVLVEKFGMDKLKLLAARAWTVKRVEVPSFVKYEQVEEMVGALMERSK